MPAPARLASALALVTFPLLSAAAFADDVIRFDLGVKGGEAGSSWNAVSEPHRTGVIIREAITTGGDRTGVTYGHRRAFAGAEKTGYQGYSPYPSSAMVDAFTLGTPGKRDAIIEIGGLSPKESYDFRFYGSTRKDEALKKTEIGIGPRSATLTVSGNETMLVGIEKVRPNLNGVVQITVKCADKAAGAALGVVEVTGSFPSRKDARRPADPLDGVPVVSAKAWAVLDGTSGDYLWGMNADEPRYTASTAQMMATWLVVRLALDERRCLDEVATISELAAGSPGYGIGLQAGDRVKVRDLVHASLLASASDATNALAEHFNGRFVLVEKKDESKDPALATRANFLAEMNRTADELGMLRTRYGSPTGDTDQPTTTARDLLNLAWSCMGNEAYAKIANTRRHTFEVTGKDGKARALKVQTTNRLLEIEGFDGIKTGTSEKAGACLVASGRRGEDHLLVVVLGSTSGDGRFVDARNLFRWAWVERGHSSEE